MLDKMMSLLKKYRSQIVYLIFGVLTTVVNYLVFFPCSSYLEKTGFQYAVAVSNTIAWVFAVLFAYVTNKPFVFESHDWSWKVVAPEFAKFVSTRLASLLIETVIISVTVDTLHWNKLVWKVLTSVLVVVLNYVGSKLLVFRRKKQG
mgnify:FL=1